MILSRHWYKENKMAEKFQLCVEALLNDKVICEYSEPELYRYITGREDIVESNLDKVNNYLRLIGRKVQQTSDGNGYYCVVSNFSDGEVQRSVRAFIKESSQIMRGLVQFLVFARDNNQENAAPLCYGETLRFQNLLSAVEVSENNRRKLYEIAEAFGKGQNSATLVNTLKSVFKFLTDSGYLVPLNEDNIVFKATAKWSLLYDMLEFIAQAESMNIETDSAQTSMENAVQLELF